MIKCKYCDNEATVLFKQNGYCQKHYMKLSTEEQIEYCVIQAGKGLYSAITELFWYFIEAALKEYYDNKILDSYKLKEIDLDGKIFGLVFQAKKVNCKSNQYTFVFEYQKGDIGIYNMLKNISNLMYKEIERKQVEYEFKDRVVIPSKKIS